MRDETAKDNGQTAAGIISHDLIKPGFHMSGKSQMVWNFTVSRPSQILPTNENSKS